MHTPTPWGRYGAQTPTKGMFEAAPGLSIGSVHHTEPIARFSGYLLPVEANVDFVICAVNAYDDLVAACEAALILNEAEALQINPSDYKGPTTDEVVAILSAALTKTKEAPPCSP